VAYERIGFAASSACMLANEVGCVAAVVFPQAGPAGGAGARAAAFFAVFCDFDFDFMVTQSTTSGTWALGEA